MTCESDVPNSGRGCPSVHSIAEHSEHTKTCEYSRCQSCGFANPLVRHHCVSRLVEDKQTLNEKKQELKEENQDLKNRLDELIAENTKLKNELNLKTFMTELEQTQSNRTKWFTVRISLVFINSNH